MSLISWYVIRIEKNVIFRIFLLKVTPNILYFIKFSLKFILCHEINGKIIKVYTYNIFHFSKNIQFVYIT
jgi:hypothetical protein